MNKLRNVNKQIELLLYFQNITLIVVAIMINSLIIDIV